MKSRRRSKKQIESREQERRDSSPDEWHPSRISPGDGSVGEPRCNLWTAWHVIKYTLWTWEPDLHIVSQKSWDVLGFLCNNLVKKTHSFFGVFLECHITMWCHIYFWLERRWHHGTLFSSTISTPLPRWMLVGEGFLHLLWGNGSPRGTARQSSIIALKASLFKKGGVAACCVRSFFVIISWEDQSGYYHSCGCCVILNSNASLIT